MNKKKIPKHIVENKITQMQQGFKTVTGREPSRQEAKRLRDHVIDVAHMTQKNGGVR
jgi:flagellin-like hook-associated protein FlgL